MQWYGGIEAGGTKFVCAIGNQHGEISAEERFPTTKPSETIGRTIAFFRQHAAKTQLSAIGIAAFGPIDPNPNSPTWGHITTTPKQHWANTDLAGTIQRSLGVPVGFDTDVNGAALGEHRWGAAQGLDTFIYYTIGTGVGGGGMVGGKLMHGLIHPEMGHIRIPHDMERDPFGGLCPYHGDCFEGLAAGPAIEARWNIKGQDLPEDHEAWELEADYIALAMQNTVMLLSPQRIILGGGVMEQPQLLPLVRQRTLSLLNGYVQTPAILDDIDNFIVAPELGNQAGVKGAIALAINA